MLECLPKYPWKFSLMRTLTNLRINPKCVCCLQEPDARVRPSSGLPQTYGGIQSTAPSNAPQAPPPVAPAMPTHTPQVKGYHDDSDDVSVMYYRSKVTMMTQMM